MILDVADDGRGFNPARHTVRSDGGFGLTSLTQRAGEAGGRLRIESTPGQGTTVSLVLPSEVVSPRASQPEGSP